MMVNKLSAGVLAAVAVLTIGDDVSAQPATKLAAEMPGLLTQLSPDARRRFMTAAASMQTSDKTQVVFYDFATRCTFSLKRIEGAPVVQALIPPSRATARLRAPNLARLGWADLQTARTAQDAVDAGCLSRIEEFYGPKFVGENRKVGPIARHALLVLRGAPLDQAGKPTTLSPLQRQITELSRNRLGKKMTHPVLLSSIQSDERTVLVFGEPFSGYRFLAEYKKLPTGAWEFKGGYDAGIL